jgi:hypothetical protein
MFGNRNDFGTLSAVTRAQGNQQALFNSLGRQYVQHRQLERQQQRQNTLATADPRSGAHRHPMAPNTIDGIQNLTPEQVIARSKMLSASSPLIKALSGRGKTVVAPVCLAEGILDQAFVLERKGRAQFVAYPNQQDSYGRKCFVSPTPNSSDDGVWWWLIAAAHFTDSSYSQPAIYLPCSYTDPQGRRLFVGYVKPES